VLELVPVAAEFDCGLRGNRLLLGPDGGKDEVVVAVVVGLEVDADVGAGEDGGGGGGVVVTVSRTV